MVLLFLQTDHTDQTNAILQKNPGRLLSAQGLAQANHTLEVNRQRDIISPRKLIEVKIMVAERPQRIATLIFLIGRPIILNKK